jgi:hypothetical protein
VPWGKTLQAEPQVHRICWLVQPRLGTEPKFALFTVGQTCAQPQSKVLFIHSFFLSKQVIQKTGAVKNHTHAHSLLLRKLLIFNS